MKQLSQAYLKIRNTARYMLGNLEGFHPAQAVAVKDRARVTSASWFFLMPCSRASSRALSTTSRTSSSSVQRAASASPAER